MANKIYLALLWHQHQPFYEDLKTGQAIMPWVRLHATKDYYDMAAILDRYPLVQVTINLVPSLLVQLQNYAQNKSTDAWLEHTLIPAAQLTEKEKCWILENFFSCNWDTMIFPNPRYYGLFEKRGKFATLDEIKRKMSYFTTQDFLDLQVWFNLAWMDPIWQDNDPIVSEIYKKGKNFTEEEKLKLIQKQKEICQLTIDKHRELWHKGQIEISTTPFYHPILPLLCDTDSAQMAMPGSPKPKKRFHHSEDAKYHITQAIEFIEKLFGKKPVGMWPSEGSVSEETASILSEAGIRWIATDEEILFRSMDLQGTHATRESIFLPYRIELSSLKTKTHPVSTEMTKHAGLNIFFRDHGLSDAIGFIYSRMDPKKAVEDFTTRICKIADSIHGTSIPPIVPVILDGENCWEYYKRDGTEFLNLLYETLSYHPRIQTTTLGNYVEQFSTKSSLKKLWSGSWIGGNFAIWIGHPEDNHAWDLVHEARDFLVQYTKNHPEKANDASLQKAWESLYVAEGSDWCWWYGDQNSSAHDEVFDQLFRTHLKNVYYFLNEEPPKKFSIAIKGKGKKGQHFMPLDLITPQIDGLMTNYYEWRAGGKYQVDSSGGTMHFADNVLTSIYYGFDMENLFLRFDSKMPLQDIDLDDIEIKVSFIEPAHHELHIQWHNKIVKATFNTPMQQGIDLSKIATNRIIELAIPFSALSVESNEPIEFVVSVIKQKTEIERWPHQSSINFKRPTEDFGSDFWSA